MVKSLRWRLQVWHALILVGVLIGFGSLLYWQLHRSIMEEADAELLAGARILEGALRSIPPQWLEEGAFPANGGPRPFPNRPPRRDQNEGERSRSESGNGSEGFRPNPDGPRPGPDGPRPGPDGQRLGPDGPRPGPDGPRPGPDGPRPEGPRPSFPTNTWEHVLSIPPSRLQGPNDTEPYFAVFNGQRRLVRSVPADSNITYRDTNRPLLYRDAGSHREIWLRGPSNTLIVVGKDMRSSHRRLTLLAFQFLFAGGIVLALGLIGGWWLTGRAIDPIQQISRTASQICPQNLSQRIDTSRMDAELHGLGTVLNSMLARLDHAFLMQIQFTADASHELRTPVAIVLSNCELALSRERSITEYKNTLEICQNAGNRMRLLVEDLLLLAKADSGKLELHRRSIDLRDLAEETMIMLQSMAQARSVVFQSQLDSAITLGDPHRLSQVFNNLVTNAIHYNREGGQVVLRSYCDGKDVLFSVADTGMGIPKTALPQLFDRFYRVDEHRSRQQGGSGLGLAICKSIVEAHGGEITVENRAEGGACFTVRLPAATEDRD